MQEAVRAGCVYFAIVFAAGFLLGALRVFALAPRVGEVAAVLVEMPLMVALSWSTCRRIVATFEVGEDAGARLVMGGVAFGLLMAVEAGLSLLAFGQSFPDFLAHFLTLAGLVGLAGQVMFGVMPLLQRRHVRP